MTVQTLYKYGKLTEHSEAVFSSPTIWFSPPAQLNDPFECRPWLTFEGTREQIVDVLSRVLRKHNPGLTAENATANAVSIFLEGRHSDPRTWSDLRREVLSILGRKIGLYCMSKKNDSILMWSHYAKDHQGYCLEFEATDNTPVFGTAQEVKYSPDLPAVDFFNTPNEEQVDLIFLTKFEGWSYESEWRIIDHASGPGVHEYPAELLHSVIFGFRMPEADRAKIRAWIHKRDHPVRFYEAGRDSRQFKIVVREIE